ncbi:hypothetical protein BDZ89DRAFT_1134093 [Hymenopellis radicata]|nr:hypothetical protein BDZ89DRAFT_1134093 [Hymenopellis radicata]
MSRAGFNLAECLPLSYAEKILLDVLFCEADLDAATVEHGPFHPSPRLPVAIRFPPSHPGVASPAETVSSALVPPSRVLTPKPAGIISLSLSPHHASSLSLARDAHASSPVLFNWRRVPKTYSRTSILFFKLRRISPIIHVRHFLKSGDC